jgi:hypothetical protein
MSTHVLDRIEEWDARPFTGGYRGLQRFADQSFSGVVRADGVELFMARGVAVAVRGGAIEAFEDASGTAYDAPSPALPLLAVMQEQSNEVRDRFYTEQTPISSVDETLSAGGFTGYIELSENVLSGDYYLVYHAGESTSVAFVGQSGRLVRGREAFESADDEVGIYQVRPVEVRPVEVPEPEPTDPSDGDASGDTGSSADVDETGGGPDREETGGPADGPGPGGERPGPTGTAAESDESTDESVGTEPPGAGSESAEMGAEPGAAGSGHAEDGPGQQSAESTATSVETDEASTPVETGTDDPGGETDSGVRVIPSVDPALTAEHGTDDIPAEQSTDSTATPEQSSSDERTEASDESNPTPDESAPGDGDDLTIDPETIEQLEQRLDSLEDECETLRERLDEVQAERDELRDQLADIRAEHDQD